MPVKNAIPYLAACLDSILRQTYTDWELVAVNDGSSDGSKAILKSYADRDSRIRTLDNHGSGIIPALQLAYRNTSGDLITRMDADDIMTEDKLAVMVDNLKNNPKSIAVGQVKYFSSEGTLGDGYRKYQDWLNGLTAAGSNFTEIYKECVIPSPCWMMHRTDFDTIGGFESNRYPEDYDLAFRMYASGFQVNPCNDVIHQWRDYANRTSRTDDNYADNRFLDIKVYYYLKIDHDPDRPLVLWGAGKKGKQIAQLLIDAAISFKWICDNPNKIGHNIYGVILESDDAIIGMNEAQVIVAVAGKEAQTQISQRDPYGTKSSSSSSSKLEWWWFC